MGFPYRLPMLNPVGRLVSKERGFLIWPQIIVYISEARGQRLIPGEGGGVSPPRPISGWRIGIREPPACSPHSLHRFCIWLTYGLHPLVSLRITRC